jgi:hypothetical protein
MHRRQHLKTARADYHFIILLFHKFFTKVQAMKINKWNQEINKNSTRTNVQELGSGNFM